MGGVGANRAWLDLLLWPDAPNPIAAVIRVEPTTSNAATDRMTEFRVRFIEAPPLNHQAAH